MASSYPAGYDVMLEPGASLSGPPLHDSLHLQITDILAAIEAELGLSPSGTDATVAATLAALPFRYVALALWTVWTPIVGGTGWALGNGTVAGGYHKLGLTYTFFLKIIFGSTSTFGAANSLTIAGFPSDMQNTDAPHGFSVTYQDKSVATYSNGHCERTAANTVTCRAPNTSSQYVATSATVPFPWAINDEVIINGTYQGAT